MEQMVQGDKKIRVSVIIPVYQVENYLERAVDSVIAQTLEEKEIILVDDGSQDASGQICDRYAREYPDLIRVIHKENQGLGLARNTGVLAAVGDYVAFVDSDDTLRKGAVQALLSKAMETNADIVQGGFVNITGHGLVFGRTGYREGFVDETGQTPYGTAWGKVIRSSLFAHLKFPEGYWFEDTIFAFCIDPFRPAHYLIPAYVYNYYRNPLGITLRSRKKAKAVDTVWIMRYLMAELAQKKEVHSAQVQQPLLQHIALAWYRLSRLDEAVQQAAFLVMQQMYAEYYAPQDICVQDSRLLALHQAMTAKSYEQYLAAAEKLT